jgi:hypothetical protein
MEVDFQTLWARAPKSPIVWKNNVAAVFADEPAVRKNGHSAELVIDHTIGAASRFLCHGLTRGG